MSREENLLNVTSVRLSRNHFNFEDVFSQIVLKQGNGRFEPPLFVSGEVASINGVSKDSIGHDLSTPVSSLKELCELFGVNADPENSIVIELNSPVSQSWTDHLAETYYGHIPRYSERGNETVQAQIGDHALG